MPATNIISKGQVEWNALLTVELDKVVRQRMGKIASRPGSASQSSSTRLSVHEDHDAHGWKTASDHDDSECTKRPSEIEVVEKCCSNSGSGKGCYDARCTIDPKDDHAILERRHVGTHNISHIDDTDVTGPVQDMRCDVSFHVLTNSFHDHAYNRQDKHENEAFNTTPDVNDLRSC